ncbi:hypothetical protein BAE44_0022069 [Dichanthelium oligosanthes]|uniref:Uncharacterized protein n=1 Tax=Dichanthelium oligosanthes TaxID=888268 RepID=A0A1E5UVE6_9POAL|nr:hypothetical protein BAE44_0022069 [Dichanthelium oligosanthes]
MASTRVCLLAAALALACVLLARSADAGEAPAPSSGGKGPIFGCNPLTDKTCKPDVPTLLPGGGVDIDGDGDEDELPAFDPHFTILGHAH